MKGRVIHGVLVVFVLMNPYLPVVSSVVILARYLLLVVPIYVIHIQLDTLQGGERLGLQCGEGVSMRIQVSR